MSGHHFLSYPSVEEEFASRLYDVLLAGTPKTLIWKDTHHLRAGGDSWQRQIFRAIQQCKSLIFVIAEDSVEDESVCMGELAYARRWKKLIIPILRDPDAHAPLDLGHRQHIDFTSDFDVGMARLREQFRWMATPAGELEALENRLKYYQRDLRRAKNLKQQARVEARIDFLKGEIERLQYVVENPQEAERPVDDRLESEMEREREPEKPANAARFIKPKEPTRQHLETGASAQQSDSWGRATMSRQEFLKRTGGSLAYTLMAASTIGAWGAYFRWLQRGQEQRQNEAEARKLFEELFGCPDIIRYSAEGNHPDNVAAGRALRPVFGMYVQEPIIDTSSDSTQLKILPEGDVILIGGPASTLLTRIVWEFSGSKNSELKRDPNPVLPLRFYGLAEMNNPSVQQCGHIGWRLETEGHIRTINWPFMDTKENDLIVPRRNAQMSANLPYNKIDVQGDTVQLPSENYLLVTKIPNFLHPNRQGDPSTWPQLVVFQGNNGLGTRAAELLVQPAGREALEEVRSELQGATAFQALFRVCDIELAKQKVWGRRTSYFHRFREIQPLNWGIEPLGIDERTYQQAHKKAEKAYKDAIDFKQDPGTR